MCVLASVYPGVSGALSTSLLAEGVTELGDTLLGTPAYSLVKTTYLWEEISWAGGTALVLFQKSPL